MKKKQDTNRKYDLHADSPDLNKLANTKRRVIIS